MDGFEALEYMKTNPCPDIILLDVMMPGLSGYDVHAYTQTEEEIDVTKVVISEGADTPPVVPYEAPKKPPEPIVRRRGDMIRDELRQKIHRLTLASQVESLSKNALLRFNVLREGNYHIPFR